MQSRWDLKQGQYSPVAVEMQVIPILAGTDGFCDEITNERVGAFIQISPTTSPLLRKPSLKRSEPSKRFKKSDLKDRVLAAIGRFAAAGPSFETLPSLTR